MTAAKDVDGVNGFMKAGFGFLFVAAFFAGLAAFLGAAFFAAFLGAAFFVAFFAFAIIGSSKFSLAPCQRFLFIEFVFKSKHF